MINVNVRIGNKKACHAHLEHYSWGDHLSVKATELLGG